MQPCRPGCRSWEPGQGAGSLVTSWGLGRASWFSVRSSPRCRRLSSLGGEGPARGGRPPHSVLPEGHRGPALRGTRAPLVALHGHLSRGARVGSEGRGEAGGRRAAGPALGGAGVLVRARVPPGTRAQRCPVLCEVRTTCPARGCAAVGRGDAGHPSSAPETVGGARWVTGGWAGGGQVPGGDSGILHDAGQRSREPDPGRAPADTPGTLRDFSEPTRVRHVPLGV